MTPRPRMFVLHSTLDVSTRLRVSNTLMERLMEGGCSDAKTRHLSNKVTLVSGTVDEALEKSLVTEFPEIRTVDDNHQVVADGTDTFVSHRAGCGDAYQTAYTWAQKGGTLQAGEGLLLANRIDELEAALEALRDPPR